MPQQPVPRSFGTHDGTFHSDDVTACALLLALNLIDADKIYRSRDPSILEKCDYLCDVGGIFDHATKRFDHHQAGYNGPLSSAGMILEYLRSTNTLSPKECDFLNLSIIRGVDAHDNGRDPQLPGFCLFSHVISNFAPIHYDASPEEQDRAFFAAVDFAKNHFIRLLERYRYSQSCKEKVREVMASCKDFLLFDKAIPWIDAFFELEGQHHPAKFVIMPSGPHWKARAIPPTTDDRMRVRIPFPESWGGLLGDDLKKISGISGAVFCHKGRFISVWETQEEAIKAVKFVLYENSKKPR